MVRIDGHLLASGQARTQFAANCHEWNVQYQNCGRTRIGRKIKLEFERWSIENRTRRLGTTNHVN